jgi:hypothetical protein
VTSIETDLRIIERASDRWAFTGSDGEPLPPEALRLLAAPLAAFGVLMLLMASLVLMV